MLRTRLCDLLGIDVPIILAGMGAGATSAKFAAEVSNHGGLGSLGSLFCAADAVKREIDLLPALTNRNFAINHIPQALDVEVFRHTLRARPAVISFALDDPGDLIRQAHDVGSLVMVQVTTVGQAVQAAERGVDVIIAQGSEAGGYGGTISTMALVPQVVDAVSPVPVVAAGGIYDGRGIESLMIAWLPVGAVGSWLGAGAGPLAVPLAVVIGIPIYLNSFAAIPFVSGLIDLGMSPATGLAFMLATSATGFPAMVAVWALVKPRAFALYLGFAITGALIAGYAYTAALAFQL